MNGDPLTIEWLFDAVGNMPLLPQQVLDVPGFATPNLRRLLNSLCSFNGCSYLEIGTLHGATLISASYRNPGDYCGLDNFSQFDGSFETVNANLRDFKDECCATYLSGDATTIDMRHVTHGVNVFFYDGHHAEGITLDVLLRFSRVLAKRFVLVVDDYSWIGPRKGAEAAMLQLGWRVECRIAIEDNYNRRGWGIGLLVVLAEKV